MPETMTLEAATEKAVEAAARAAYEARVGESKNCYSWGDPCFYAEHPDDVDRVYEEARAALSAALASLAEQGWVLSEGWQTMENCPDHGESILVCGGRHVEPTVVQADGRWWRASGGLAAPTHWQPLPAQPSQGGGK
jgi:hypothetical protein